MLFYNVNSTVALPRLSAPRGIITSAYFLVLRKKNKKKTQALNSPVKAVPYHGMRNGKHD